MKIANEKVAKLLAEQAETGPVYVKKEEGETIALSNDVKMGEGQFGKFLTINADGIGTKAVTLRPVAQGQTIGQAFRLEIWEAVRDLAAAGARRAINKGQQKVFAVAL